MSYHKIKYLYMIKPIIYDISLTIMLYNSSILISLSLNLTVIPPDLQ